MWSTMKIITMVFNNLLKGSENHLRTFNSLLTMYTSDAYKASEYLTQDEIDAIIAATRTIGNSNSPRKGGFASRKVDISQ